ncbi:MAG: ThuA domain-containing protein [Limisphaerales bacterium]
MKPLSVLLATCLFAAASAPAGPNILLIAGKQSHGPGDHEFRAGTLILARCLAAVPGVTVNVASNGWPASADAFGGANAVVIYADGGGGHPAIQEDHLKLMQGLAARGVGLGFMHFGVEVPAGDPGEAFKEFIGGHYEHQFSVNPMWTPQFDQFPDHPVTRGVRPFAVLDEWYFNLRFRPDLAGVTPILVATPSDDVRDGPYVWPKGPYPHVVEAKGRPETMMWVRERPDGGRGFGFTGGHRHANWGDDSFRKVVLNAILWIAKAEVPAGGVACPLAPDELKQNLDPKK